MTTNELTKIWAKISGLFARKTEVATKADKAVVVTLSPDVDQQIVADKTFAEVYALLVAGNEVMFDLGGVYWKAMGFSDTVIVASLAEVENGEPVLGGLVWNKERGISFSFFNLQEKLMFDDEPTHGSVNPVKSGGVYDAFNTYCPIIEDTRSSAVAAITGVAPFASLVDGQRIMLNINKNTIDRSTLELTLSNGSSTGAIAVMHFYNGNFWQISAGKAYGPRTTLPLIYRESLSAWVVLGGELNTSYPTITQKQIDAGTATTATTVTPKLLCDNFDRRHLYVDNSADASVELSVATYNDLGTTDAPVVSLPASYTAADEFLYSFTCATDACVVTLPQGVVLADCCDDFSEVGAGVWFQVSIMDGVAAYLCVTPNN